MGPAAAPTSGPQAHRAPMAHKQAAGPCSSSWPWPQPIHARRPGQDEAPVGTAGAAAEEDGDVKAIARELPVVDHRDRHLGNLRSGQPPTEAQALEQGTGGTLDEAAWTRTDPTHEGWKRAPEDHLHCPQGQLIQRRDLEAAGLAGRGSPRAELPPAVHPSRQSQQAAPKEAKRDRGAEPCPSGSGRGANSGARCAQASLTKQRMPEV